MLHDLSVEISRVKNLYDQYFLGMEKLPPTIARRDVEKAIAFLSGQTIGNTALKFRFQTLLQRWKTNSERWDKVLREIENGTFQPHRAKARRKLADWARGLERPDVSRPTADAQRPLPPSPVPGMSEADLRALHQSYVEALRRLGDTREVRYDRLVGSLAQQVPTLLQRNACSQLSFAVVIREGKVVLKAQPKESDAPAP
jgi:hypothetical protein